MPTLAQVTKALADKVRGLKLRRQCVYNEANRFNELLPMRNGFGPLLEDGITGYQVFTPPGIPYNENNRSGSWGQFGQNNDQIFGGPDHRVDLFLNFTRDGYPAPPRKLKSVEAVSIATPQSAWSTVYTRLYPIVCYAGNEWVTPFRTTYGIPIASLSGQARVECYFDVNGVPAPSTWFPLRFTVDVEGLPIQVFDVVSGVQPPVYQNFPTTHVKESWDHAWLGQKNDLQYPKCFIILDDGMQTLEPSSRFVRKTSFLVMFVAKKLGLDEAGAPILSADASFGYPYGSEAEQVSRFIEDLDTALRLDETLGGTVQEVRMEGFVTDSGLAYPEGAVWVKVAVEYHA